MCLGAPFLLIKQLTLSILIWQKVKRVLLMNTQGKYKLK